MVKRAVAVVMGAILGVASLAAVATTASAGTQVNTNACRNSATGTFTDVAITTAGTAAPNPATLETDTITVTGTTYGAFFDAATLIAGYNLGLLTLGVNNIPGTLVATVNASNTAEGTITTAPIALVGQTTITDPDGTPGTGDETGTDLAVSVAIPDSVWTPTGGTVEISDGGAVIVASVAGGLINVTFTCQVGTSTPAGCVADPLTDCTGASPAAAIPFDSVTVEIPPGVTTTTAAPTTTTTAAPTTTAVPTTTIAGPSTTSVPVTTTTAPPSAATGTYATECKNSATPDITELDWILTATAPASVEPGDTVVLADQNWSVTVPGTVFGTGVKLGLLEPGQTVTADVSATVTAANTAEGKQTESGIPISLVVELDGDGEAKDVTAGFSADDMTFTATGGDVGFAVSDVSMAVDIGLPLPITFTCTATAGQDPFITVEVSGTSPSTTSIASPTTAAPTSTVKTEVQGQQQLALTGTSATTTLVIAILGFVFLDLGYLAVSAIRPARRRDDG